MTEINEGFYKRRSHLSYLPPFSDSEGTAVCEIVHMRSESEGRPERTFQLCCRYFSFKNCKLFPNKGQSVCIKLILFFCPLCSSPGSKKDFLKAVHSILREKQRRQLMKTESLPPNQQYVPFGGKRLSALKGARPTMNRTGDQDQLQIHSNFIWLHVSRILVTFDLCQLKNRRKPAK